MSPLVFLFSTGDSMKFCMLLLTTLVLAIGFLPAESESAAAEPGEAVSCIDLGDYRLYLGKDSNGYAVYSTVTKRWTSYNFPKHMTVKPWGENGRAGEQHGFPANVATKSAGPLVGFELSGAPIEELVAVDGQGRFCTHKLETPLKRTVKPFIIGDNLLYCIVDGKIYAFSSKTGTWDVLDAPEIPEPQWKDGTGTQPAIETGFEVHAGEIKVKLPFGTMTFAADQGRWKLTRKPASEEVSAPAPRAK